MGYSSRMKVLLCTFLFGLSLAGDFYGQHFNEFKRKFDKNYKTPEEENERFNIFKENMKKVLEHNREKRSFTRAINFFSDLTEEEFKSTYLGLKRFPTSTSSANSSISSEVIKDLPNEVNWVEKGSVTEADWPYVSGTTSDGEECTYDLDTLTPVVGLTGYNSLTPNDEAAVMQHIAEVGPLSIAVDASTWHSYNGGVF